MKLIHLTDPHLVAPGEQLFGLNPAARLAATIDMINREHADAACCVITGDLADHGQPEAYAALAQTLKRLTVPVALALGNHDRRGHFRAAFPDEPTDRFGYIQSLRPLGDHALLVLDTLVEGRGIGALDGGRLTSLTQLLQSNNRPLIVACHHPIGSIGMNHFASMAFVNGADVLALLKRHATVRHILCGHVHVDVAGSWSGIPFTANRGVAHHIVPNLDRYDATFVARDPAFAVLRIDHLALQVHHFTVGSSIAPIAHSPDGDMEPYALVAEPRDAT